MEVEGRQGAFHSVHSSVVKDTLCLLYGWCHVLSGDWCTRADDLYHKARVLYLSHLCIYVYPVI